MKKHILIILFIFISGFAYSQSSLDSISIYGYNDYVLNKKNNLAYRTFVVVGTYGEYVYSMKFYTDDLLENKIWLEVTHTYKRIKNKKGKWIDYKKKGKELTLIQITCSSKEYAILENYKYDGNGKIVSHDNYKDYTEFNSIVPDSMIEMVYRIACYKH